jgi:peptidyl-prolyl cis-trans isomerase SurA
MKSWQCDKNNVKTPFQTAMLKPLLAAGLLLFSATAFSQTLFTYGGDTVTVPQFLAAYSKNNAPGTKQSLRTYLDLYIASRLKIKEAKARGYDTLPQITSDLAKPARANSAGIPAR